MLDPEQLRTADITRRDIWDRSVPVAAIASGLRFTEGPVWHPVERHLVFSDIPANTLYRLDAAGKLHIVAAPSNHANGNAYDRQGRLVTCEHGTSRVVRRHGDAITVLADRWNGCELNSPNDVIVARNGAIYFTDPPFGRQSRSLGGRRPIPQPINGVYRLDARGIQLMADDFDMPNGLCLSPDQRTIFIADTARCHIRRFEIADDGDWSDGVIFADVPSEGFAAPDGLKCDAAGNLLCSGAKGIHIFDADGVHRDLLPVPELVANFTHGGTDMKTLYIAASTSIYRARLHVPGIPVFEALASM